MMDFLRGLAPHHANDGGRAMAALPSRFEAARPLRVVPVTAAPADPPEPSRIEDSASPVDQKPLPKHVVESSRPPDGARHTLEPIEAVRDAAPPARIVTGGLQRQSRSIEPPPPTAAAARAPVFAAPVEARQPPAQVEATARAFYGTPARPHGPVAAVHPGRAADPNRAQAARDARPLSREIVATRAERAADRRPIVHVTIDRIDVRAPAAAERAKPPVRSRASTPSGTLADYLRARERERQGGAR